MVVRSPGPPASRLYAPALAAYVGHHRLLWGTYKTSRERKFQNSDCQRCHRRATVLLLGEVVHKCEGTQQTCFREGQVY